MAKRTPTGDDLAERFVEETFDAPDETTAALEFVGTANLHIVGNFIGQIILERSFDGGQSFAPVTNLAQAVMFTGAASETVFCREAGVLHRLRCVARTSGSALVRLSQ